MSAIAVHGLAVSYGALPIFTHVDLSVQAGERRVLIGPNGAGKTTLFNILSGFKTPTAGRVTLFGKDVTHLSALKRARLGLGRTFQVTSLFPSMSVEDNLMLALARTRGGVFESLTAMRSRQEIVEEGRRLLARWHFLEFADSPINLVSYGLQRQLEIVLVLAQKPAILLLDEPTAGLTPTERDLMVSMVLELGRDITLLVIEHDIRVAFSLADRVTVLNYGQVLAEGTPQEIERDPRVSEIYLGQG